MPGRASHIKGVRVFECAQEGGLAADPRAAVDLMSAAFRARAQLIAMPAERLDDGFFRLRTRLAGEFLQKFVNYNLRVAIVGDITSHISASNALRDSVRECNRGRHIRFVRDGEELAAMPAADFPT